MTNNDLEIMTKKDELFMLIKSLDKHEKRFFKLYAKLHNHNKQPQYVYIFDVYDKMRHFDNSKLVEQLSKILPDKKNISRQKQYLRRNIINALKAYNKRDTFNLKDSEDINTAKIFITKKLYPMAEKILMRLRKTAIAQENARLHLQTNTELINIMNLLDKRDPKIINQIEQYYEESLWCAEELKEKILLRQINSKASRLYYLKDRLKENVNNSFVKILEEDLAQFQTEEFLSKQNSLIYYNLLFMINSILYRNEAALKTIKKVKKIIESPVSEYYPVQVATAYINILHSYLYNKIIEPFLSTIHEAQLFLDRHPELKPTHQYMIYLRELEFYFNYTDEKPGKQLFKKITEYVDDKENDIPFTNKNMLLKGLAMCYFKAYDYTTCHDILLKITLEYKVSLDEYYFIEVSFMDVLCYYELDMKSIAKQRIEIFKRKLKRSKIEIKNLTALIQALKQIVTSKKEKLEHFEQLNGLMPEHSNISIVNTNLFSLWVWAQLKIETLSID